MDQTPPTGNGGQANSGSATAGAEGQRPRGQKVVRRIHCGEGHRIRESDAASKPPDPAKTAAGKPAWGPRYRPIHATGGSGATRERRRSMSEPNVTVDGTAGETTSEPVKPPASTTDEATATLRELREVVRELQIPEDSGQRRDDACVPDRADPRGAVHGRAGQPGRGRPDHRRRRPNTPMNPGVFRGDRFAP